MNKTKTIKYIDLFAGLGGTRIGLTQAIDEAGFKSECVFTSEIKPHAISVYKKNFPNEKIHGDITQIKISEIPDFDILLAGFPCQPFSFAGNRKGFADTRGTLFFEIERILAERKPSGFLLENVEGLVSHDLVEKPIGRTLQTILNKLESLGYIVSWKVLDASKYGIPQRRKRIYIVGSKNNKINLNNFIEKKSVLSDVLEDKVDNDLYIKSKFTKTLLQKYSLEDLKGKQIKDKRGGKNNIHSWDLEIKGPVNDEQKQILEELLKQRRRKSWAKIKGIPWSDGMALSVDDIYSFHKKSINLFNQNVNEFEEKKRLEKLLDDLVSKKYLAKEIPRTAPDDYKIMGYNIVVGKLSFEISHILHSESITPTLVATDVTRLAVVDNIGLRRLSIREGLRLFGFPDSYNIKNIVSYSKAFDLLGNSVSVGVIKMISKRLIKAIG